MSNPILNLGNNEWATKKESLLGYSKSGSNFKPVPFTHSRASVGTTIDRNGVLQTISGDTPRIDFKDNEKGALLLEPQRTNLLIYSKDFANAIWSKQGVSSVTSNTTTAPDGSLTADTLSGATGTGVSGDVLRRNIPTAGGFTLSIYVKSLGSTNFTIYIRNGANGQVQSQSITPNDTWQRVSLTHDLGNGQVFFGNTNGDVAIWGAQLEQGTYASSYIPTEGSTVTRLKDECVDGGNSDLFDITEGTFFVDVTPFKASSFHRITLSDGTTDEEIIYLFRDNNSQVTILSENGGVQQVSHTVNITFDTRNKLAFTFKNNEFKFYVNGSLVHTHTSGTISEDLNALHFAGNNGAFNFFQGKVHDTRVYDRVLTEAEAITLTTL